MFEDTIYCKRLIWLCTTPGLVNVNVSAKNEMLSYFIFSQNNKLKVFQKYGFNIF